MADTFYVEYQAGTFGSVTSKADRRMLTGPVMAFYHYMEGSGAAMKYPLSAVDLSGVSPQNTPAFKKALAQGMGSYQISGKFAYRAKGLESWLVLGHFTLKYDGQLDVNQDGSYNFNGQLTAYDDRYDFNASTHRTAAGEASTTFGRVANGTPYDISITGSEQISISGGSLNKGVTYNINTSTGVVSATSKVSVTGSRIQRTVTQKVCTLDGEGGCK